jgi:hypothetical protein
MNTKTFFINVENEKQERITLRVIEKNSIETILRAITCLSSYSERIQGYITWTEGSNVYSHQYSKFLHVNKTDYHNLPIYTCELVNNRKQAYHSMNDACKELAYQLQLLMTQSEDENL